MAAAFAARLRFAKKKGRSEERLIMKNRNTNDRYTKHMFSNAQIRALLIPLMIEQLLNCLMGMADTLMISNVGPVAMSAVSLVDSVNILFIQAFSALAAGGSIVCSQYIGKKDGEKANQSARQMFL